MPITRFRHRAAIVLLVVCATTALAVHAFQQATALQQIDSGEGGARFGSDVAASGGWLAIGIPASSHNADALANAGAVRLYRRGEDGRYVYSQLLHSPVIAAGAAFGASVALWGDRLAIGAPNAGSDGRGRVEFWEYDEASSNWEFVVGYPGTQAGERFGAAVALHRDRVAVGAPFHAQSSVLPATGRVVSFVRNAADTFYIPVQTIVSPALSANQQFGSSVAIVDYIPLLPGVLPDRLLVGEPVYSPTETGLAWIFEIDGGDFAFAQLIAPPADFDGVAFGHDVAIGGVYNAVGALRSTRVGVVRRNSGGGWTVLTPVGTPVKSAAEKATVQGFGESIAFAGNRLLVGNPRDALHAYGARAHLFEPNAQDDGFDEIGQLLQPGGTTAPWERFGRAVAMDGWSAIVAAPNAAVNGAADAGRVAIYSTAGLFGDGFEPES